LHLTTFIKEFYDDDDDDSVLGNQPVGDSMSTHELVSEVSIISTKPISDHSFRRDDFTDIDATDPQTHMLRDTTHGSLFTTLRSENL